MGVIFITGIDTNSGKTTATGLMARYLKKQNKSVITQKIVQTGCENVSDDILTHRKIMETELTDEDKNGTTCPFVFKYPSSPKLAAKLEIKSIDIEKIQKSTDELAQDYDNVLIEGIGGVYVPLKDDLMVLDYMEMNNYPVVLVTSAKLGSINHTILTLDAIAKRDLALYGVIYNKYPEQDKVIIDDTKDEIVKYLSSQWFNASIVDIPVFDMNSIPDIDFSGIFSNE
ncbi:MAG: ATP-dependent dethiobiotin synthetase BioD [Spirochaetes bacterium]|nr:ATP-dependent dethiobiotin synthetase BioD [Spirochaetota bacterium]